MARMGRRRALAVGGAFAASAVLPACRRTPSPAKGLARFAEGLNNPRNISFDDKGYLLVAEPGYGEGDNRTGRVSRIGPDGVRTTVVGDLPYGFDPEGEHVGLTAALARGEEILILYGQGAGDPFRHLLILQPGVPLHTFNNLGVLTGSVVDLLGIKNPFDMAIAPDGWIWVVDSERNEILRVSPNGRERELVREASVPEDSRRRDDVPFGPEVPAGIAFGPDGYAYVAIFTRRPHIHRSSWVARVDRGGKMARAVLGLTMAIDVAFDREGTPYVLEFSQDYDRRRPATYMPDSGRVLRGWGRRLEVVAEGLNFPVGMAFGPDGDCYVSVNGAFAGPGEGWIARFTPPPRV